MGPTANPEYKGSNLPLTDLVNTIPPLMISTKKRLFLVPSKDFPKKIQAITSRLEASKAIFLTMGHHQNLGKSGDVEGARKAELRVQKYSQRQHLVLQMWVISLLKSPCLPKQAAQE